MSVLEVRDLDVELGGRRVLHDVDLTLEGGQLVGLLGPNGAGKTTLIRSALGLVRPRSGSITTAGAPLQPHLVGYVPQRHEFSWDFPVSVEDAVLSGRTGRIGLFRRARAVDFAATRDALERVDLIGLRNRSVGELSGGQRQRVLVARALALQSPLLLLDEPFTGIDMPTQELLTDLFCQLSREGKAVLMSTHDVVAAVHTCDRVVLLNRTVVADGTPTEVQDRRLWMQAFEVGSASPLLTGVGV